GRNRSRRAERPRRFIAAAMVGPLGCVICVILRQDESHTTSPGHQPLHHLSHYGPRGGGPLSVAAVPAWRDLPVAGPTVVQDHLCLWRNPAKNAHLSAH